MQFYVRWFSVQGNNPVVEETCTRERLAQLLLDQNVILFAVHSDEPRL